MNGRSMKNENIVIHDESIRSALSFPDNEEKRQEGTEMQLISRTDNLNCEYGTGQIKQTNQEEAGRDGLKANSDELAPSAMTDFTNRQRRVDQTVTFSENPADRMSATAPEIIEIEQIDSGQEMHNLSSDKEIIFLGDKLLTPEMEGDYVGRSPSGQGQQIIQNNSDSLNMMIATTINNPCQIVIENPSIGHLSSPESPSSSNFEAGIMSTETLINNSDISSPNASNSINNDDCSSTNELGQQKRHRPARNSDCWWLNNKSYSNCTRSNDNENLDCAESSDSIHGTGSNRSENGEFSSNLSADAISVQSFCEGTRKFRRLSMAEVIVSHQKASVKLGTFPAINPHDILETTSITTTTRTTTKTASAVEKILERMRNFRPNFTSFIIDLFDLFMCCGCCMFILVGMACLGFLMFIIFILPVINQADKPRLII